MASHDPPLRHSTRPLINAFPRVAITYRKTSELRADPLNPRQHSAHALRRLRRIIQDVGFLFPIAVDDTGLIVCGEARWLAANALELIEVPTVSVAHLTRAQQQLLTIFDNRIVEHGKFDDAKLGKLFLDLSISGLELDLELSGFDTGEIDILVEKLNAGAEAPADDRAPPPQSVAVSKLGDLWLLNGHRILVGNALNEDCYRALMDGAKANAVFCDPPYNLKIDGHVSGLGRVKHREFAYGTGEFDSDGFIDFLARGMRLQAKYSVDGSLHYQCIDWRHIAEMLEGGRQAYTELKNICVWKKDNGGMGSLYRSAHEFVVVFKSGRSPHRNNIQLGRFGRYRTNVWEYAGANTFGSEERDLLASHPTPKPVALIADAILDSTARGDIVLDSYLGSGSTAIAAERTGRRCFGMEINSLYVDTILRRFRALTGQDAVHAATGKAFTQLEKEAFDGA